MSRDPARRSIPWCDECNQHRNDCDCRNAADEREELRRAVINRLEFLSPWERRVRAAKRHV